METTRKPHTYKKINSSILKDLIQNTDVTIDKISEDTGLHRTTLNSYMSQGEMPQYMGMIVESYEKKEQLKTVQAYIIQGEIEILKPLLQIMKNSNITIMDLNL